MAIKAVIFDFDGVLVESVDIKTQAFAALFKEYPEHIKEICQYHKINGGISRQRKFLYIYKNILKKPLSKEKFNELCSGFHTLVVDRVVEAPFVDGAERLLKDFLGRYQIYIISGTPQNEMRDIIRRRRLERYFDGVYGSPRKKKDIIHEILRRRYLKSREVIFIGDSISDLEAAKVAKIYFIAKVSHRKFPWLKDPSICATFRNLNRVYPFLRNFQNKNRIIRESINSHD